MRHALRAEAYEKVADRFAGTREHERSAAERSAQKNLQSAVPADVVEGAPDDVVADAERSANGRRQCGEVVRDHSWRARRPRREEDPVRVAARGWSVGPCRDHAGAGDSQRNVQHVAEIIAIRHDRVRPRVHGKSGEMFASQIGRADDEASGNSVELDEGEGCGELIVRGDEGGAVGELGGSTAEARAGQERGETNAAGAARQHAFGIGRRVSQPVANRRHGVRRPAHRS